MSEGIDWKEAKYQEKLAQIFTLAGTDFYNTLCAVSSRMDLPLLNKELEEKIGEVVKREYPSFSGSEGSRPDIFLETNKGNILVFELKPGSEYDEVQLSNHNSNMMNWINEEDNIGKKYLGCIGIFNRDSEREVLEFSDSNIYWVGWDSIYKALYELKTQVLDSELRQNIDKIFMETPITKLNDVLKRQLLRETEKNTLFNTIRISVLVIELMDQLKQQMNLDRILKRYENITGTESHKDLSEKVSVLYDSLKRSLENTYKNKDWCSKIENDDYDSWIRFSLKHFRGGIDLEFKPLSIQSKDHIILRLWMQSGSKYSLLKPLVSLFSDHNDKYLEFEETLSQNEIEWYGKFGSADPIPINVQNMEIIQNRQFLPIYCDKKIEVFNRTQNEILEDILSTVPVLIDLYFTLLDLAD